MLPPWGDLFQWLTKAWSKFLVGPFLITNSWLSPGDFNWTKTDCYSSPISAKNSRNLPLCLDYGNKANIADKQHPGANRFNTFTTSSTRWHPLKGKRFLLKTSFYQKINWVFLKRNVVLPPTTTLDCCRRDSSTHCGVGWKLGGWWEQDSRKPQPMTA